MIIPVIPGYFGSMTPWASSRELRGLHAFPTRMLRPVKLSQTESNRVKPFLNARSSLTSAAHAVEEHDRKILRQDEQDLQDEAQHTEISPNGEGLLLMPHPLCHPVNPVNPVKIQFFNCIAPAKADSSRRLVLQSSGAGGLHFEP
jgi:hypothetical protein